MKKLFIPLSILLLTFVACDNQSCENVRCPFGRTCVLGDCLCPAGYEGDNCNILSRDKYLGTYQVNENCANRPSGGFFFSTITIGSDDFKVNIGNMANTGLFAEAFVTGNFVQIPSQNLGATTISGSGEFFPNTNTMRLQYDFQNNLGFFSCTAIYTKQ